jgi:hypothetical protein
MQKYQWGGEEGGGGLTLVRILRKVRSLVGSSSLNIVFAYNMRTKLEENCDKNKHLKQRRLAEKLCVKILERICWNLILPVRCIWYCT